MADLIVQRVDVWAAPIRDEPGSLANLLIGLREAGADLDFVIARRAPDKPGKGVVFVTPLRGDREVGAAAQLGFNTTDSVYSVRVEGPNERGIMARLTEKLGAAGIAVRGCSASVSGARFVAFLGLDSSDDAAKAADVLSQA
jgi:hypothetical protein